MESRVNISNRKAGFEYYFISREIAGLQLLGTEVKGIKEGLVSFVDSFCYFNKNELFLKGLNIGNPKYATSYLHDPLRERKLLLNKQELKKLSSSMIDGATIVPVKIFTSDKGFIKIEIALAKGKKNFDKRETIKARDIAKETKRELNK